MSKHHSGKDRDILKRLAKLEREALRLRQGVMESADAVAIGGASEAKSPVQVVGGASASQRVSVLTAGKDAIALSANNDFSGADFVSPDGFVTRDSLAASVAGDLDDQAGEWKTVLDWRGGSFGAGIGTGTVLAIPTGWILGSTANSFIAYFTFDPASYADATRDLKCRIPIVRTANGTAPGAATTYTVAMNPLSSVGGTTSTAPNGVPGAAVTGSSKTHSAMTAGLTPTPPEFSNEFDAPNAGIYALSVTPSNTLTATVSLLVSLEVANK